MLDMWALAVRFRSPSNCRLCICSRSGDIVDSYARLCPHAQDLEWTVSMSSSEDEQEELPTGKQRGLLRGGIDAFVVALHR